MKVKIVREVPIDPGHGIRVGDVRETVTAPEGWNPNAKGRRGSVWVMGDAGEKVRLLPYEWEREEGE